MNAITTLRRIGKKRTNLVSLKKMYFLLYAVKVGDCIFHIYVLAFWIYVCYWIEQINNYVTNKTAEFLTVGEGK